MTIKNMVSKELESTVEKITSKFQSDLNIQLTKLVANAIEGAQTKTAPQNGQKNVDSTASVKEISELKLALEEEKTVNAAQKQKFQVELTQLKINHTESIESLEYRLEDMKAAQLNGKDDSSKHLIKEVDNLKGQLSKATNALNEKEKHLASLKVSEKQAAEKLTASNQKQKDVLKALEQARKRLTVLESNTQTLETQTKQIADLKKQLVDADATIAKSSGNESKLVADAIKQAEKKYSEIIGKLQQEQSINAESKLKETSQQQLIDLQQQQIKDHFSSEEALKKQVLTLTEAADRNEKVRVDKEKSDIAAHEKNTTELRSQLKSLQQEHDSALMRFNTSKEKQEQENMLVRDTIKNLRHENNELKAQQTVASESVNEQVSMLEQKVTEYRLKFEYAQKQITKMTS
jgi:hypothetical protein